MSLNVLLIVSRMNAKVPFQIQMLVERNDLFALFQTLGHNVTVMMGPSFSEIKAKVTSSNYDIIHYIGYGTYDAPILAPLYRSTEIDHQNWIDLIRNSGCHLAFFNCNAGFVYAEQMVPGLSRKLDVICLSDEISSKTATRVSKTFYENHFGHPVRDSRDALIQSTTRHTSESERDNYRLCSSHSDNLNVP